MSDNKPIPFITVITVVFNAESSIEDTMLSLFNQTFTNFEYIVIDGNSTDNTIQIIKKYEDKISCFISENDKGIYDAMNKGVMRAKGDWLYFLNSNDRFYNNNVLKDVADSLYDSKYSLVVGKVMVTSNEVAVDEYPKPYTYEKLNIRKLFSSHFCHQAVFQRRQSFFKYNLFSTKYRIFADFELMGKVALEEKGFTTIPQYVAFFDGNGYSSNWRNMMNIFQEQEAILSDLGAPLNYIEYKFKFFKAKIYYFRKKIGNVLAL